MATFAEFGLSPEILHALDRMGFKEPLPIQIETITCIQQKRDLIALAQTGSGKTAACAIPICNRVDVKSTLIQTLIIVPTRELAVQYATETQKIGKEKGVKAFAIYGGEDATMQLSKIKHGVQVLVATPGRLIDFIYSRDIDLSHVDTLILDEADEMLSMGFLDDLEFVMQCLVHEHQTLLFSATMPATVRKIAKTHMNDPLEISLITDQASPENIDHKFIYCKHHHRETSLIKIIGDMQPKQAIVFCRSRHECESLCHALQKQFDAVDYLHAGLNQDTRSIITGKFRSGKIRLMIATDVAARGLDFSGITHVFMYHLADDADTYLHRSGRTGRRSKEGSVISLVTDRDLQALDAIVKRLQKPAEWIGEAPPENVVKRPPNPTRRPPFKKKA